MYGHLFAPVVLNFAWHSILLTATFWYSAPMSISEELSFDISIGTEKHYCIPPPPPPSYGCYHHFVCSNYFIHFVAVLLVLFFNKVSSSTLVEWMDECNG